MSDGSDLGAVPAEQRVGFVVELAEPGGYLLARFAAHAELADGTCLPGPDDVALDSALQWARRAADVVYVTIGGDAEPYSAGRVHPDGVLHRWPDAGIAVEPRPYGTPYDGSVQRVSWQLTATVTYGGDLLGLAGRLRAVGRADPRVRAFDVTARAGDVRVVVEMEARSLGDGVLALDELLARELADEWPGAAVSVRGGD